MKELYLTWDFSGRLKDKPVIELSKMDSDTKEITVLVSKNDNTGIWYLNDLLKYIFEENTHDNKATPMSCTGENCPLEFGKVERCTNHNCEDRTPLKTNFEKITESPEALAEFMDNYEWCPYFSNSTCDIEIECKECIKEWLKKESE